MPENLAPIVLTLGLMYAVIMLVLPFSILGIHSWVKRTCEETQKTNKLLQKVLQELEGTRQLSSASSRPDDV